MSPHTLSAVIEKHIRQLCLTDFPCGRGSLRKTVDGAVETETVETDSLLDLLICPHSPWWHDASWSPQAVTLRKLAVLSPERLHTDFIHKYFTALRIVDEDVSVVDGGLLKFSKLEELVLSANRISEIPADNLPCTLKVLELRGNQLSALSSLTRRPPPHLWYLGLGSNGLGSCQDAADLSGRHWPQLVCLDLGDCEFEDQRALLSALTTLPCLKTLVLEGNPFTLAHSYPGLTVDTLPQLSCLDHSWITPEERHRFQGLAKLSDVTVDQASVTVRVGRVKGIPDPLMSVDETAPDFPVVTYSYFITYEFLTDQTPVDQKVAGESKCDTEHATEDDSSDADPQSDKNCEREKSAPDTGELNPEEACCDVAPVSRHSTSKLTWSEHMDFSDTHVHTGSDLGGLKKFLSRGLSLRVEEEKVLSWPAASEDVAVAKPGRPVKEKKGGQEREVRSSPPSNLVLPKTSLETRRRSQNRSWSRTPPSGEASSPSTSPCKVWSEEMERSTSSVTSVPCTQSLWLNLHQHLRSRIWKRKSKRKRRRRTRTQRGEEAVVQHRRTHQKVKERPEGSVRRTWSPPAAPCATACSQRQWS
ncbi:leucine-rich repeat-containing protein 43-like isoform X2 [Platichthys flesus]|uniref:leucine-rich repeat-containing protein 43-like isoform X2 n=1 Tax=Platichthys flesus TaxID=8260 RepID=UPI002DB7E456|nr:leucine-rich repeat-containing protein 43-like isoform X2 [Platichthys flesus]